MYSIFSHSLFDENSHLHQYLSSSTRCDLLLSMIIAIIIALISDWYTNWHQWELRAMLGHLSSRELKLTPLMITTHTPLSIIFFIQDDKAKDTLFSQQISICLLLTEQTAVSNCRLAFVCSLQSKLQFQHFHPGKWRLWMIALDFLGFHKWSDILFYVKRLLASHAHVLGLLPAKRTFEAIWRVQQLRNEV